MKPPVSSAALRCHGCDGWGYDRSTPEKQVCTVCSGEGTIPATQERSAAESSEPWSTKDQPDMTTAEAMAAQSGNADLMPEFSSRRKPTRAKQLGVTEDEYARLLEAQGDRCAIHGCNRTPKTRRFHADHNHETLQRRGLLCHWHNRILPKTAREAYALAQYLDTWESRA